MNSISASNNKSELKPKRKFAIKLLGYGLFWSWNLIFCIVAGFLIAPYVVIPLVKTAISGASPWDQALMGCAILLLPLFSVIVGITVFRKRPGVLLSIFYGFEMPLLFIFLFRIILLRDMNPGLIHLLINLILALSGFLLLTWHHATGKPSLFTRPFIAIIVASLVLTTGSYLAMLIFPYVFPLVSIFLLELSELDWLDIISEIFRYPTMVLAAFLFIYTASLFFALPFVTLVMYIKSYIKEWRLANRSLGPVLPASVTLAMVSLNVVLFVFLNQQPHPETLKYLSELEQNDAIHDNDKTRIIAEQDQLRDGLINAYLGAYRYVSTTESSNAVLGAYHEAFEISFSDQSDHSQSSHQPGSEGVLWRLAHFSQDLFNGLAKPFLYEGKDFREDRANAVRLYQHYFDEPIEKAEKQAIINAMNATWEREQMAAGLINAVTHYVYLTDIRISLVKHGDLARINIFQRMENQTFDNHEITLHFSLPDDAVITGLWLSDDDEAPRKYSALVSPRGAAQQVYNDEVQRRIDPSLLEKTGPRQYRLRAFPVPARILNYKSLNSPFAFNEDKPTPMLIEFEYITSAQQNSALLPKLLESRNVYWNDRTRLEVNENTIQMKEQWMPEIDMTDPGIQFGQKAAPSGQLATVIDNNRITALPVHQHSPRPINPADLNLAILVDSSFSMHKKLNAVRSSLEQLISNKINFDPFTCTETCKALEIPLNIPFYGNRPAYEQFQHWLQSTGTNQYDALILLTDAGSYELSENEINLPAIEQPVWLVHLGGLPYAYPDQVVDMIKQSQGGIAETIMRAVDKHLIRNSHVTDGTEPFTVSNNYYWFSEPVNGPLANGDNKTQFWFRKMAALKWLDFKARQATPEQLKRPEILDEFHAIALQHQILSDYSSMIVLINDRQKEALKKAEAAEDRYEREVEQGTENITAPTDMFAVSAVPEPEEWILIGLVTIMVGIAWYRNRRYPRQGAFAA